MGLLKKKSSSRYSNCKNRIIKKLDYYKVLLFSFLCRNFINCESTKKVWPNLNQLGSTEEKKNMVP